MAVEIFYHDQIFTNVPDAGISVACGITTDQATVPVSPILYRFFTTEQNFFLKSNSGHNADGARADGDGGKQNLWSWRCIIQQKK